MNILKTAFMFMLLGAGVIIAILGYPPILLFYLFLYLNLYLHEFGHALIGSLVNFPVQKITIGTGQPLIHTRIGHIELVITNNFGDGRTSTWGDVSTSLLKIRFLLFVLGGIGAQSLAIVISILLFDLRISDFFSLKTPSWGVVFVYTTLFHIIVNLIPRNLKLFGLPVPNDGRRLLLLPSSTPHDIQKMLFYGKIGEAYECYQRQKFEEAEQAFQECIQLYPEFLPLKVGLPLSLIKQLKLQEAQAVLETLLETYNEQATIWLVYHALAWVYFLQFTEETLQRAADYAQKASILQPQNIDVIRIRAYILFEQGAIDEGMTVLQACPQSIQPTEAHLQTVLDRLYLDRLYLAYAYYFRHDHANLLSILDQLNTLALALAPDEQHVVDHILVKTGQFNGAYVPTQQTFNPITHKVQTHVQQPVSRIVQVIVGSILGVIAIGMFVISGVVLVIAFNRGRLDFLGIYLFVAILVAVGIGTGIMAYRLIMARGAKRGGGVLASTTYLILGCGFIVLWILTSIAIIRERSWKDLLVMSSSCLLLASGCFAAAYARRTRQNKPAGNT